MDSWQALYILRKVSFRPRQQSSMAFLALVSSSAIFSNCSYKNILTIRLQLVISFTWILDLTRWMAHSWQQQCYLWLAPSNIPLFLGWLPQGKTPKPACSCTLSINFLSIRIVFCFCFAACPSSMLFSGLFPQGLCVLQLRICWTALGVVILDITSFLSFMALAILRSKAFQSRSVFILRIMEVDRQFIYFKLQSRGKISPDGVVVRVVNGGGGYVIFGMVEAQGLYLGCSHVHFYMRFRKRPWDCQTDTHHAYSHLPTSQSTKVPFSFPHHDITLSSNPIRTLSIPHPFRILPLPHPAVPSIYIRLYGLGGIYQWKFCMAHYLLMTFKQLNVKQAERWLQRLKNQNLQSYKDITKFLRKYEKTEDQYDCYIKISHTLLTHSELTKELNTYMEEGNRFVVNRPDDEKIKEFMGYVKRNRAEVFDEIIRLIQDLSRCKGENPMEISKSLKPRLRDIIKGDAELERITEEALDLTGEELISRKNLDHLKIPKTVANMVEDPEPRPAVKENPRPPPKTTEQKPPERARPPLTTFTNPSQQRAVLRQLEKMIDQQTYTYIVKIIKIYYLNIITRNEAFDLLANLQVDELYMECVRDIIDARETERRKMSLFRPLNDMNFSNAERASPSYVSIPIYYPIVCSGKSAQMKLLTNDKWVSVPYGSEESQNFSVRNKNSNQINLLKAEDERYEFDIYMKRLEKTHSLLQRLLDDKPFKNEEERTAVLNRVISMGVLQLIYKNCHRDQKEEFQWFLKANEVETLKLFKEKIALQINQLKGIKEIHANKNWSEVAVKNFFKALDLKGFEFKKNEKEKMKGTFFISQLQERSKTLENGGQAKNNMITFEDKKEFFTILNSFESSSRTERCTSRTLPNVQTFDLKDQQRRHFYPLMILALEEQPICQHIYSLLLFYIESSQTTEAEKIRCKLFLQQFLVGFLGWTIPVKRCLSENFDQEKLYNKIANSMEEEVDLNSWLAEEQEPSLLNSIEKSEPESKTMGFVNDKVSEYSYLPAKSDEKIVLYGSEHLYTLSRFIYAVYERLIKMREVAQDPEKILLFEILFYACIKAKEGIKFEENLNLLFGKHAYLFSTLYKLFDNLLKSLSNASICPLINYSFKYSQQSSEDIYFVLLNRFCLANNLTNNKVLRLTYHKGDRLIYFNYLESYYKCEEVGKDIVKKRLDIAKGIEIYTIDSFGLVDKKRRKPNDVLENNELEYIFEGNTIKMLNHAQHEDLLFFGGKRTLFSKTVKREIKRAHKLVAKTS